MDFLSSASGQGSEDSLGTPSSLFGAHNLVLLVAGTLLIETLRDCIWRLSIAHAEYPVVVTASSHIDVDLPLSLLSLFKLEFQVNVSLMACCIH